MQINVRDIITVPLLMGLAVLFVAAGLPHQAQSAIIDLAATRDATIYSQSGGDAVANGAGDFLIAGQTASGGAVRRSLIGFDVSGIPAGSTIAAVILSLFMDQSISGPQTVSLHRILADWAEGPNDPPDGGPGLNEGVGIAAVAGDVTFVSSKKGTSLWTLSGGDFVAGASASELVGDVALYTWTGPGLVSDIQGWVDGLTSNFGWLILGNEATSGTTKRFASRQHNSGSTVTVSLPNLRIEFDPPAPTAVPEPSTILLLGSGLLGFGLLRRRRWKAD